MTSQLTRSLLSSAAAGLSLSLLSVLPAGAHGGAPKKLSAHPRRVHLARNAFRTGGISSSAGLDRGFHCRIAFARGGGGAPGSTGL